MSIFELKWVIVSISSCIAVQFVCRVYLPYNMMCWRLLWTLLCSGHLSWIKNDYLCDYFTFNECYKYFDFIALSTFCLLLSYLFWEGTCKREYLIIKLFFLLKAPSSTCSPTHWLSWPTQVGKYTIEKYCFLASKFDSNEA